MKHLCTSFVFGKYMFNYKKTPKLPNCFSKCLDHFAFLPAVEESFNGYKFSPTLNIVVLMFSLF